MADGGRGRDAAASSELTGSGVDSLARCFRSASLFPHLYFSLQVRYHVVAQETRVCAKSTATLGYASLSLSLSAPMPNKLCSQPAGNSLSHQGESSGVTRNSRPTQPLTRQDRAIQSCRGTRVDESPYTDEGLEYDRQWMIVDAESHKFLTARTLPKMVLIHPTINRGTGQLEIAVPSSGETFSVPLAHPTTYLANPDQDPSLDHDYVVWNSPAQDGYTVGSPELHAALSAFLCRSVLLIRKGLTKRTVADVPGVVHSEALDPVVGFADFYALLLASATSLAELNRRVPTTTANNGQEDPITLEINRFRANVVVEGLSEPWEEDGWKQLRIGDEPIEVGFRCARCMVSPVRRALAFPPRGYPSY